MGPIVYKIVETMDTKKLGPSPTPGKWCWKKEKAEAFPQLEGQVLGGGGPIFWWDFTWFSSFVGLSCRIRIETRKWWLSCRQVHTLSQDSFSVYIISLTLYLNYSITSGPWRWTWCVCVGGGVVSGSICPFSSMDALNKSHFSWILSINLAVSIGFSRTDGQTWLLEVQTMTPRLLTACSLLYPLFLVSCLPLHVCMLAQGVPCLKSSETWSPSPSKMEPWRWVTKISHCQCLKCLMQSPSKMPEAL